MCGIVGITSHDPVTDRLLNGLERLEYRGYDSAGIAVCAGASLTRRRRAGKLENLRACLSQDPLTGQTGIAHTRWATHGKPTEANAHPHQSGPAAIVHNGIIENFSELRRELQDQGKVFESETDSEVIAQLLARQIEAGLDPVAAFEATLKRLEGAFAIVAILADSPGLLLGARRGSPLVVGHGEEEMFLGSDAIALASLSRQVTYLEEGDWVIARPESVEIRDSQGNPVTRPQVRSQVDDTMVDIGNYPHFMLKEIHEQPDAVARSIAPMIDQAERIVHLPGDAAAIFSDADRAVAVACGTANYAAQVSKYWFEQIAGLALETDIASEFRYRHPVLPRTGPALFISQSGETADTLAALRYCKEADVPTLAIVNVAEASIAREASALLPTMAGPEIGVASTKAFTAQLSVLATAAIAAARARRRIDAAREAELLDELLSAPRLIQETLRDDTAVKAAAKRLSSARDAIFLGRGPAYPLALEGALKLKEISYIHAEGYAAGELKHGPIALLEDGLPVIVVAPKDAFFEKTVSNMEEVQARGAAVILITDEAGAAAIGERADEVICLPSSGLLLTPLLASVPLQLLAYHTALLLGTDVDKPRNLAKSVTVE